MPNENGRIRWILLSMAVAVALGLIAVGAVAALGAVLFVFSTATEMGIFAKIGAGVLIVLASIVLGAVCGALVGSESIKDDTIVLLLVIGASVVGAAAGALAFATGGLGMMALAGVFGLVGAVFSARGAAAVYRWLRQPHDGAPPALKRFLP